MLKSNIIIISFGNHEICLRTNEVNSCPYGKNVFCEKPPNCLPEWLHHFVFSPVVNEYTCCSTSSSALCIVSVQILAILIDMVWYLIDGLVSIFFMTCVGCPYLEFVYFFGEMPVKVFAPPPAFFFL